MNKLFTESELLDYFYCILESSEIDASSYKLKMILKLIKVSGWNND